MKKSELYQMAMMAVVDSGYLTTSEKIEIIDQLLTDQRVAKFNEEALKSEEVEA